MGPAVSVLSVSAQTTEHQGRSYKVVTLAGRVTDATSRRRLRQALEGYAHQMPNDLVVDLRLLEAVDRQALTELVRAAQLAGGLGGWLALAAPQPEVEQMIRASGADRVIALFGSAEEAMAG